MPEKEHLLAIRRMLLERHEEVRAMLHAKNFKAAAMFPIDGMKMARGPKGFPADHAAMELILQRQWGVSSILPAKNALVPDLADTVLARFRMVAPLVGLLNEPLAGRPNAPLF